MTPAPSPVLLLGWDGAPRAGEQPLPSLQPLVQALAPQVPLAVVLPRSYSSSLLTPNAQVTTLAQLRVDELATLPADRYPANWQHPMAPYVGSTAPAGEPAPAFAVPAAPYIGSEEAPVPSLALSAPRAASPAASTSPAAATPDTDKSANAHALFPDALETGVEEALDLLAAELPAPAAPAEPEEASFSPELATLPQALAALSAELPPSADLNYQVIQYARFATRQALSDNFGVIYATDWPTWLAAMEIRQQTGRPLVLHVHSLAEQRNTPADRGWALELERLALRRADLILAASDGTAERLRATYPATNNRVQVVAPNDTDTINSILRRLENR